MGKGRLPVTGIIAKNSVVAAGFPVNGSLLANEEVDLVAEIVGKVRKIYFQEGVAVKKGTAAIKSRRCRFAGSVDPGGVSEKITGREARTATDSFEARIDQP